MSPNYFARLDATERRHAEAFIRLARDWKQRGKPAQAARLLHAVLRAVEDRYRQRQTAA